MKTYVKYCALALMLCNVTFIKPIQWPYWFEKNVGFVVHPLKAVRTGIRQAVISYNAAEKEYPGTLSFFMNICAALHNFGVFTYEYCSFDDADNVEKRAKEVGKSYFIRNIYKLILLSCVLPCTTVTINATASTAS